MKFNPFKDGFKNKLKESLHPKNVWKKVKENKTWAITGIAGVVTTSVVVPTAVILTQEKISFDGQTFSSASELASYLQNAHLLKTIDKDNAYSLDLGDEKRYFTSPSEVYQFLKQNNIQRIPTFSSKSMYQSSYDDEIIDYPLVSDPRFISRVYRGNNNSFFAANTNGNIDAETEAIKSYLQMHQLYYFNGKFFKNQADLKHFLTEKTPDVASFDKRILIDNNNVWSLPITPSKADDDFLKQFLVSNSREVFDFKDGSGKHTIDELKQNPSLIPDYIVPYYQIHASQGHAKYLIDMKSDTNGSLVGPYLYDSANNPNGIIQNTDFWQQTSIKPNESNFRSDFKTSVVDGITNLTFSDDELQDFFLLSSKPETDSEFIARFSNENNDYHDLKAKLSKVIVTGSDGNRYTLLEKAKEVQDIILSGKKASVFKTIILLRSWMISQIMEVHASSSLIYDLSAYFDYLARVMGFRIEKILSNLLSDEAKNFNFGKVFNFLDSKSVDVDPNYFVEVMLNGHHANYVSASQNTNFDIPEATEIFLASFAYLTNQSALAKQTTSVAKEINNYGIAVLMPGVSAGPLTNANYNLPNSIDQALNGFETYKGLELFFGNYAKLSSMSSNPSFSNDAYNKLSERIEDMLVTQKGIFEIVNSRIQNRANSHLFDWSLKELSNEISSLSNQDISANVNINQLHNSQPSFNEFMGKTAGAFMAIYTLADVVKDASKVFSSIASKIRFVSAALLVLSVAIDIFAGLWGTHVQDYYSYQDPQASDSFIWTGGSHTEHSVFGFSWNTNVEGKENLHILEPLKIFGESLSDGYYLNNRMFNTVNEAKKVWIESVSREELAKLHNVETTYQITLQVEGIQQIELQSFNASSFDDLASQIANVPEAYHDIYISESGITTSFSAAQVLAINEALAKIHPLWVVQLPKYINGTLTSLPYVMPDYKNVHLDQLSGVVNDGNYDYWFINSNIKDNNLIPLDAIILDQKRALEAFVNFFKDNFSIESKLSTFYDITHSNTYDEISPIATDANNNPIIVDVYSVLLPSGQIRYFGNEGSAFSFLIKELGLTKLDLKEDLKIYGYNDHEYEKIEDFVNAVLTGGIYD